MGRVPCSHPDDRVRFFRSRQVPLPIAGVVPVDVGRCAACCRQIVRIRSGDDWVTFDERDKYDAASRDAGRAD